MIKIKGNGLQAGIAEGPLFIYKNIALDTSKTYEVNPHEELRRLEDALCQAETELEELAGRTGSVDKNADCSSELADIIEAQIMIVKDPEYRSRLMTDILENFCSVGEALINARDALVQIFTSLGDDLVLARISDIEDVTNRIIRIVSGVKGPVGPEIPSIVIAEDIAPSELLSFDKRNVLGMVLARGNEYGHTAILAKSMGIPLIINADILGKCYFGSSAIIDGESGKLIIEPDEKIVAAYRQKISERDQNNEELSNLTFVDDITMSGRKIKLYANISSEAEVPEILRVNGKGIGLYRSEFFYLKSSTYPSEEMEFENYKNIVKAMDGRRTIIRTLDVGYDKCPEYFNIEKEDDSATGIRGIRFCLENEEIFRRQLRTLYRASVYGKLAIMFPMISTLSELQEAKRICKSVAAELESERIAYDANLEIGIMIETPDAVMIADELAREADFFSIGTNDLSRCLLASDRNHDAATDKCCDKNLIELLDMIKLTIQAGHRQGIWVGVCGELAGDADKLKKLIQMGIDEVSVAPGKILEARKVIRCTDL